MEAFINSIFFLNSNSKFEKLDLKKLYELIEIKFLWGNSYLYNGETHEWFLVNQLEILKTLNMTFKHSEKSIEIPKRKMESRKFDKNPTENINTTKQYYLEDYVQVYQKELNNLIKKNLEIVEENLALKVQQYEQKSKYEIEKISLESINSKRISEISDLKEQIKDLGLEIIKISDENKSYKVDYNDYQVDSEKRINELLATLASEKKNHHFFDEKILEFEKQILLLEEEKKQWHREKESIVNNFNQALKKENEKYKRMIKNLTLKKDEQFQKILQEKNKERLELLSKIESVEKDKEFQANELKKVKLDYDILVTKKGFDPKSFEEENSQLNLEIKDKDLKIATLLKKQDTFKEIYRRDFTKAKTEIDRFRDTAIQERERSKKLTYSLDKYSKKAMRLEALLNQQKQLDSTELDVPPLESIKSHRQPIKRASQLGKLFEFTNKPIWEIKGEQYLNQKYCLTDLKKMQESEELHSESYIRKEGTWWKKVREVSELNLELIIQENDHELKCFIERQNLRVPIKGSILLYLNDDISFTGKILNISSGGCQLELKEFSKYELDQSLEFHLLIRGEHSLNNQELSVRIKNIDMEHKLIGLEFISLSESEIELVENYINLFIREMENAA